MIKEQAKALIDKLPDDATWEDLMYEIYVREAIEAGLEDSKAGRITPHEDVRKEFGLS
jgi:predicted transcriptional regulator